MRHLIFAFLVLFQLAQAAEVPRRNPRLVEMPAGRWLLLHEQGSDDALTFKRQAHAGACFDSRRGRIVIFGSDTHGRDWSNSPLFFDVAAERWTRAYRDDPRSSYAVDERGLPVAGAHGRHPWAMHTFGALICDAARDELVVASMPQHMVPGRFSNSLEGLWERVGRHPTWTFDLQGREWSALDGEAVHFFAYCAAYAAERKTIYGYRPNGVFVLEGAPRRWRKVAEAGIFGWHTSCVWDEAEDALVVFGTNKNANDTVVYRPGSETALKMPTSGRRPPADQHNPMAYEPRLKCMVVLVDRTPKKDGAKRATTETWLYDLAADRWRQLPSATLPFACGMNYMMVYDPRHEALLLVAEGGQGRTAVWALKIDPGTLED